MKMRLDLKIGIIIIVILVIAYILPIIPMYKNVNVIQCIKAPCEGAWQKQLVFVRGLDLISLEDLLEFLTKRYLSFTFMLIQ